ncbi:MAG: hypothetical protein KDE27_10675 [Planctomycetes bacterium]|nr:hypothetical protein [Planctomycetota bacterium]
MASSPSDPNTSFLLQELTACWDQGYEALARGDVARAEALVAIADEQLAKLQPAERDTATEGELRRTADAARGRLEHGVRSGLAGLRDELRRVRQGGRALQGYKLAPAQLGDRVHRDA